MYKHWIGRLCALLIIYLFLFFSGLFVVMGIQSHRIRVVEDGSITPLKGIDFKVNDSLAVKVDGYQYIVPPGFKTDLASIPRFLWQIIAPNEASYVLPSILHDYMYTCPNGLLRKQVDDIFYYFLLNRGVSYYAANRFYIAVRLFGAHHFQLNNYCFHSGDL